MPKTKKHLYFLNVYRHLAIGFAIVALALVGTIVFYSLVQATVTVYPRQTLQSVEFLIGVGQGAYGDKVDGQLATKDLEEQIQVEATGTKDSQGRAAGKLTIINTTEFPQTLVATTRFLTPEGILFRLKNKATVPAKGRVEAEVAADKTGAGSDIGPSKFTIPGLNQAKQKLIWGESAEAMMGGDSLTRVITVDDLANGKKMLAKKLEDDLLAKFKTDLPDQTWGVIGKVASLDSKTEAKVGEEKQNFSMSGKISMSLVAYDAVQLADAAKNQLLLVFPPDKELLNFVKDKILVKVEDFDLASQRANLRVYADGQAVLKKTSLILNPDKIAGMTVGEAKKYLESFEAVDKAEIILFPSWLKKIPSLKDHIEIIIKK